jgi:REP element-mobilizing transposase RayT
MALYKNKYRIESARLKGWDYSSNGYYFVTICTKNRECFFGDVVDGKMQLNEIGKIADKELKKTEQIRKNVKLDEYRVMPNHVHGVIVIENEKIESVETTRRVVSTTLKPNSLGSIIGQFKSIVTKCVYEIGHHQFGWQERFHDHIIRDEESLNRIREYIRTNPLRWHLDKENPNRTDKDKFDIWFEEQEKLNFIQKGKQIFLKLK